MKPDRPNTKIVLIDIKYYGNMNNFEEFYGNNVTYQELEQESYIEFKDLMFNSINKDIKFRKHERIGRVLTIKANMFDSEIELFKEMIEEDVIKLVHEWIVSNVTIIVEDEEDKPNNDKKQK